MKIRRLHGWDLDFTQARALQDELKKKLVFTPPKKKPRLAAGVDCGYDEKRAMAAAAVLVFEVPSLKEVARASAEAPISFPYVSGLLSFRETPVVLEAFRKLNVDPDVVFFDAHGTAHPKRFGLACHAGLWLGIPTIGVGKSVLCGTHRTPPKGFGAHVPLVYGKETIGAAFRAAEGRRPVYVSPGHLMDLPTALLWTRLVCDGKRVPKPTREADRRVRELI